MYIKIVGFINCKTKKDLSYNKPFNVLLFYYFIILLFYYFNFTLLQSLHRMNNHQTNQLIQSMVQMTLNYHYYKMLS